MKRLRGLFLILLALVVTACGSFGAAPTPTIVPSQLGDQGMQQAALAAVQDYAAQVGYDYRNPSFDLINVAGDKATVHASVSFNTRKGFPWEDYDTLITLRQSGNGWAADRVNAFTQLDWEVELTRGPATLKSDIGYEATIPANWSGYVASASDLTAENACGIGPDPISSVPILLAMPTGYSVDNVPIVVRGFQQCPRAQSLSVIRQRLEAIRDADQTLTFDRLELANFGGDPALIVAVADQNKTVIYDIYVLHDNRQLEFVVQSHEGIDETTALSILNSIKFK